MALQARPAICERARAWASLRMDGELSELEDALLAAHLLHCAPCAEFEESARMTVVALRACPPERLHHAVSISTRRRILVRPLTLARAAALVAAIAGVTTVLGTEPAQRVIVTPPASAGVATAGDSDYKELRMLRRIQLGGQPSLRSGVGVFGATLSQRP
jgi:predicted anti-sigma-YlaC factor YlaD